MDELLRRQNSLERNVSESLKQHKDDHAELLSTLRGRLWPAWSLALETFGDQGRNMGICFLNAFVFPEISVTL